MKKTQLLSKFALELKAVSYFSADLYLIAQTIGGNHDWNRTDVFPFAFRRRFCPVVLMNTTAQRTCTASWSQQYPSFEQIKHNTHDNN